MNTVPSRTSARETAAQRRASQCATAVEREHDILADAQRPGADEHIREVAGSIRDHRQAHGSDHALGCPGHHPAEASTASATVEAYRLQAALVEMVTSYGEAKQEAAYAHSRYLDGSDPADLAEHDRWRKTTRRRFTEVQRLARALVDLGGAS